MEHNPIWQHRYGGVQGGSGTTVFTESLEKCGCPPSTFPFNFSCAAYYRSRTLRLPSTASASCLRDLGLTSCQLGSSLRRPSMDRHGLRPLASSNALIGPKVYRPHCFYAILHITSQHPNPVVPPRNTIQFGNITTAACRAAVEPRFLPSRLRSVGVPLQLLLA